MKRFIPTATLAWLLAGGAQPGVHTSTGAADPQAAVPATDAGKTIPLHEHHAGMDMQGMQCMAGADEGKGCCAGMTGMQCMAGGKCGCCHQQEAT